MASSLNPSLNRVKNAEAVGQASVSIFRADAQEELCHLLVDGHEQVLRAYGIKNLTSFNRDWIGKSDVMVIAVTDENDRVLGGARMLTGGRTEDLPLYAAVGDQDLDLASGLQTYMDEGAYELGGLWNSIELAGMGVDATFLIKAAMAAMPLLDARHLFALTSPVTRRMQAPLGFHSMPEFGIEGFFTYPTERLKASIARFTFPDQVKDADDEVQDLLRLIWEDPLEASVEVTGPKGLMVVSFNIQV